MPPTMMAAVQQEAERLLGAARLPPPPARFTPLPLGGGQEGTAAGLQIMSAAPGQPVRIRGMLAAGGALGRAAGALPPRHAVAADLRKYHGRPPTAGVDQAIGSDPHHQRAPLGTMDSFDHR
jgi:hypothetical protein